ncbi:MAG: glycosyltransferase family 25 protein [Methyloligellaceae bacterium]
MPQIPIWVINLPQSKGRWEKISTRLDALGLSYERREATYGKNMSFKDKTRLCPSLKLDLKNRPPVDGELGCYASHLLCIKEIVQKKIERVCIIEDDTLLHDDFPMWVQSETPFPKNCEALKLSGPKELGNRVGIKLGEYSSRTLVFSRKPTTSTGCYILNYSGAVKVLNRLSVMYSPIDHALFEYWNSTLKTLDVLPYPAPFPIECDTYIEQKKYSINQQRKYSVFVSMHRLGKIKRSITKDLNRHLYPLLWFGKVALKPGIPLQELVEEDNR